MPRKKRIDFAGGIHHIMARTFNDLLLFRDNEDRRTFLTFFQDRLDETAFRCYAWALMPTHFHLLVKTTERPLWQLMKPLSGDYARFYNKKYNRRGPLFADRYKSIIVQDQYYLEQLVRYIHLNPVKAGLCKTISQLRRYPWSGHSVIMNMDETTFMDVRALLQRFGDNIDQAREEYEQFIAAGMTTVDNDLLAVLNRNNEGKYRKDVITCWVIGDADFQKDIIKKDTQRRIALSRVIREDLTLADIQKQAAECVGVDIDMITCVSKGTPGAHARKIFCYMAREAGFQGREIGEFLHIGQAAVSCAARRGMTLYNTTYAPRLKTMRVQNGKTVTRGDEQ